MQADEAAANGLSPASTTMIRESEPSELSALDKLYAVQSPIQPAPTMTIAPLSCILTVDFKSCYAGLRVCDPR